MRTDFRQVAALVESGPVRLDQHETDPLGSCGRIGLCRQNNEVAANSVGNEDFLSVDDVMIAIFYGARLDILHIATAAWLGHAGSPKFFDDDDVIEPVGSRAAILFGNIAAKKAKLTRLSPQLARETPLALPLVMIWRDLFVDKTAYGRPEGLMI